MKRKLTLLAIASIFSLFTAVSQSAAIDMEATAANWKQHCSKCHAKDGSGDTKMGKKLKVQDYRDPAVQAKFTEESMLKAMTEGMKNESTGKFTMKPLADKLTEEQMKDIIVFVRTLEKKP